MDRELWTLVLNVVDRSARIVGWNGGRRRPVYSNYLIVAMYLWSLWHGKPLSWACRKWSYNGLFRPRVLPSVSQFTRRIDSEDCQRILQLVNDRFAIMPGQITDRLIIDGKPLLVSPVSGDREARRGRISGGFGKGYKLHAVIDQSCRIVVWSVTGLNTDEKTVARQLLPQVLSRITLSNDAWIQADSHYDSAPLHTDTIMPLGLPMLSPLAGQKKKDGKYRASKLKKMPASRRELVQCWKKHPALMRYLLSSRADIERTFGTFTCSADGLSSLPAWVRGTKRVRRYVGGKIIFYNAMQILRLQRRTAIAA
jgi:Transposase DDE domain